MLQKIKVYLVKKNILKHPDTETKIKFLLDNVNLINLYSSTSSNTFANFLHANIVSYLDELSVILISSLDTKAISVKQITEHSYINTSFSFWYTYDKVILNDDIYLKEFLSKALAFVQWSNVAKVDYNSNTRLNNFRRLSPYYHNITEIIETLYNLTIYSTSKR